MPNRDSWIWPLGLVLRHRRPGTARSLRHHPALSTTTTIDLASTAFPHGGAITRRHSGPGRGPNVSPELHWGPLPAGTAELLLVLEDVDVPTAEPGYHLAVLLPPNLTGVPEGGLTADNPRLRWIPMRKGRTGYFGPRPIPGHGDHRYGFHLLALDSPVPDEVLEAAVGEARRSVAAGRPRATAVPPLLPHLDGRVLARGFLEGHQRG